MGARKHDHLHADTIHISQMTPEDQLREFLEWLPTDLQHAPGIDWGQLPGQAAGYLVKRVGTSPDAAYLAVATAAATDALRPASLLSMLYDLHSLLRTLRTMCGVQDLSDLRHEHAWHTIATRVPLPKFYSGQFNAYSCITHKHVPAYLERLSVTERQRMSCYALPPLPPHFLKQHAPLLHIPSVGVQPGEALAFRRQREQMKKQQARTFIREHCQENPDVTCQELLELLIKKGIRMGSKSVNTIRRELGQQRPSGSVAGHLRTSSIGTQARDWLVQQRKLNPDIRAHTLQAGLRKSFGIELGTRQINNILRELGVSRPGPHRSTHTNEPKTSALFVETPTQEEKQTGTKTALRKIST